MATPREVMQEMINMTQELLDGYTAPEIDENNLYNWHPIDSEMNGLIDVLRSFALQREDCDGNKFFTASADKIARECLDYGGQFNTYDIRDRIDKAEKQAREQQPEQEQPNPYEIPEEVREQAEQQQEPTGRSHDRDDLTR